MLRNISIITTHFKDFPWVELLIKKLVSHTDMSCIHEIIIINQDRCLESKKRLESLHRLVRVVEYPVSQRHFAVQGHDHAAVLNQAVLDAEGSYICIFDSDAHPFTPNWLTKCNEIFESHDAILARCPVTSGTHPCFMFLKSEHTQLPLAFDERVFLDEMDTGRLIGEQLERAGRPVFYAEPKKSFSGLWGSQYLDCIYHHGSGSFHAAGPLLTAQVTWYHGFFRKAVLKKEAYDLTLSQRLQYVSMRFILKLRHSRPKLLSRPWRKILDKTMSLVKLKDVTK